MNILAKVYFKNRKNKQTECVTINLIFPTFHREILKQQEKVSESHKQQDTLWLSRSAFIHFKQHAWYVILT